MFWIHGGPRIPPQSTLEADTHILHCNNAFHFRIQWFTARGGKLAPLPVQPYFKLSWKLCAGLQLCLPALFRSLPRALHQGLDEELGP